MVDGDDIGYREHVVQAGDTLSAIAQEHYGAPDVDPLVKRTRTRSTTRT